MDKLVDVEALQERIRQKNKKKMIMVVDDSALMLRTMKTLLGERYDVVLVKSGTRALELLSSQKPDLILLDYEMEGMDGKTTFEKIKEKEELRDIPVVFLTGVSDRQATVSVLKLKPDGYILKPPDEEQLMDTIRQILFQ